MSMVVMGRGCAGAEALDGVETCVYLLENVYVGAILYVAWERNWIVRRGIVVVVVVVFVVCAKGSTRAMKEGRRSREYEMRPRGRGYWVCSWQQLRLQSRW